MQLHRSLVEVSSMWKCSSSSELSSLLDGMAILRVGIGCVVVHIFWPYSRPCNLGSKAPTVASSSSITRASGEIPTGNMGNPTYLALESFGPEEEGSPHLSEPGHQDNVFEGSLECASELPWSRRL